jgi:hypothetical protein
MYKSIIVSVNQRNRLNGYESYSHLKSQNDFLGLFYQISSCRVTTLRNGVVE